MHLVRALNKKNWRPGKEKIGCIMSFAQVRKVLALAVTLMIAVANSGCSGSSQARGRSNLIPHEQTSAATRIPNRFASAIGKQLRDRDIDSYIDPSVVGADRELARKLMKMMPPNRRGDFVLYDGSRVVSNNPALVPQVKITDRAPGKPIITPQQPTVGASAVRRTRSDGGCAPPFHPGSGPYAREVGSCGFSGAWTIVNLACNTTQLNDYREDGYMYIELRDASGGLQEAGMYTSTGLAGQQDIHPYLAGTGHSLQNSNSAFTCGTYLGMMAGLAPNPSGSGQPYLYVSIGTISDYNPQNAWLTTETVTEQNPAWLFDTGKGDFNHPGPDSAGNQSPCQRCSVTKVTSIAQSFGDRTTGSYFGVTNGGQGDNAIHYYEVTYGNWQAGCNSSLCSLAYSTDSTKWYVGPDYWPNAGAASAIFNPNGAVYESQDGIVADFTPSESNVRRRPASAFVVPAPPSCSPDAYGYCVAVSSGNGPQQQYCQDRYGDVPGEYLGGWTYLVQDPNRVLRHYDHSWIDDGTGNCNSYESWSPAEPSVQLGDPNLP